MFPFTEIISLILKSFLQALVAPQFLLVFMLVVVLIAVQYWRAGRMRDALFRQKTGKPWVDVMTAAGFGLIGGLAGSCIMVFVGLTLSGSDLIYLWPVAILLMLINMRFLCFAYSGGVLALSSLLFAFPQVNIPQIMALVAILHMVESMLILTGGHLGASPAYIKGARGGVTGGFALQRFWPIPLVVLAAVGTGVVQGGVEMPAWWPLLKADLQGAPHNLIYTLMPVIAGLGYSDVAVARSPAEKSRLAAFYLSIYSILLLALAVLAQGSRTAALAAALFCPLGHEAVIYLSKKSEYSRPALYVPPERGVRVLDVLEGGVAWQAGIRSGDIILALNGMCLTDKKSFEQLRQHCFIPLTVEYYSRAARENRRGLLVPQGSGNWGLVLVPERNESEYIELCTTGPLGNWLGKISRKFQS